MSSEAQKLKGYPIPEEWITEETASYCIVIPAGEDFRRAAYAQLLLLGKYWNWKRDDGDPESTRAKNTAETWRLLFEFNENCGDFNMTPEELTEAICNGLVCAAPKIGLLLAQGASGGGSFDEDGNIVLPDTGGDAGGTPVEDDPTTPLDETAASRMGGVLAISKQLESVWDKIDALFGVPSGAVTPVTPLADAQYIMVHLYICDATLMETAVDEYYTWRLSGVTQIAFNASAAFQQYLYCNGWSYESLFAWVTNSSGWVLSKQKIALKFWESLGDQFYSDAYAKGALLPSTAYAESSCYPSPTEVIKITSLGVAYVSQTSWKNSHRLLWTVENYVTDADGDVQDFWWYTDPPGVPTNRIASVNIQLGTGITKPTVNQVPYSSGHKYQFTIDTPPASGSAQITLPATGMNAPLVWSVPADGIKVTIEDLGEI